MGCGCSQGKVAPTTFSRGSQPGSSRARNHDICAQCGIDSQRKVATWWCEDCQQCICNYCAWNHSNVAQTKSHYLVPASSLPKPKPLKPAWEQERKSKQALLIANFDSKADLHYVETHHEDHWNRSDGQEYERGECLLPIVKGRCCPKRYVTQAAAINTACTFLPGGYIAVADYLNEQVKLFDSKFNCSSYIKLEGCSPIDICSHGSDIFVSIENKCKLEKLNVTLPVLCFGRKLERKEIIKTDGYCDSIAVCRLSYFSYGLVAGMTFSSTYYTKRYQVHIMNFNGEVKKMLFYDNTGQTLFHGKVFVSGSTRKGEIYVSDKTSETIQGFNIITGEGLFNITSIQEPLGLTVDKKNNIYVITNACFYWIPPEREDVIPFLR
ncbi:uncharacterized protein LOC128555337 [Mercenaria mercenaria]|uniref:uncharacterized protein LOC128555337 n=1 Tax=Mercenaria mercenaria TaxID=6596 RepID=UPI00234ED9AC|nr:uncharacterized protein LOC128555337 [Mercenaria mercenaria]